MAKYSRLSDQFEKRENNKPFDKTGDEEVIIVGAGPCGLAVAACLAELGISSLILERDCCVASSWKHRAYDRLKLQGDKRFAALPFMQVPDEYPMYLTRNQFVAYIEEYADRFNIQPQFCQSVEYATFCQETGRWHVVARCSLDNSEKEYLGRFLVVATGEFSEKFMPDVSGLEGFTGTAIHSIDYKNAKDLEGKKVLVVGCGNSGMEISLDLVNYDAKPSMVVRSTSHILPRDCLGMSTIWIGMRLLKLLPVRIVDKLLLMYCNLTLGDTASYGIPRPAQGPFEMKIKT